MAESTPEDLKDLAARAEPAATPPDQAAAPSAEKPAPAPDPVGEQLAALPPYARGLLKIRIPVRVTLAAQRKSIQEIMELGPGAIISFDKTCDEPVELSAGDRPIAHGEVVKVGDKFGLRISGLASA